MLSIIISLLFCLRPLHAANPVVNHNNSNNNNNNLAITEDRKTEENSRWNQRFNAPLLAAGGLFTSTELKQTSAAKLLQGAAGPRSG